MHAFVPVPGGHASRLADTERTILARLVADTAELLGTRLAETASGADAATGAGELPVVGDLTGLTTEDAVLAALDFTPAEHLAPDAPADPALARLLPPMSHDDPELAAELRALTEHGLRSAKVARLETVWRELRGARPGGAAVVRAGQEGAWLAALTDVRLVLASRLGIEDERDAEAVYDRAHRRRRERDVDHDEVAEALATMYAALTWWQESLLESMERAGRAK